MAAPWVAQAIEMREAGATTGQIAAAVGRSARNIRRILNGPPAKRVRVEPDTSWIAEAIRLRVEQDMPVNEIAARLHKSVKTLRPVLVPYPRKAKPVPPKPKQSKPRPNGAYWQHKRATGPKTAAGRKRAKIAAAVAHDRVAREPAPITLPKVSFLDWEPNWRDGEAA